MPTKAEIEQELQQVKSELEKLKKDVVDKARELAEEHDWCEVVDQALDELGLDTKVKIVVDYNIREHFKVDRLAWESMTDAEREVYLVRETEWDAQYSFGKWQGTDIPAITGTDTTELLMDENAGNQTLTVTWEVKA